MKHLSYNEFTELMKNKGETWVHTENSDFKFYGINEHTVSVEVYIKMKDIWNKGTSDHLVWSEINTLTEAQCMYMNLIKRL